MDIEKFMSCSEITGPNQINRWPNILKELYSSGPVSCYEEAMVLLLHSLFIETGMAGYQNDDMLNDLNSESIGKLKKNEVAIGVDPNYVENSQRNLERRRRDANNTGSMNGSANSDTSGCNNKNTFFCNDIENLKNSKASHQAVKIASSNDGLPNHSNSETSKCDKEDCFTNNDTIDSNLNSYQCSNKNMNNKNSEIASYSGRNEVIAWLAGDYNGKYYQCLYNHFTCPNFVAQIRFTVVGTYIVTYGIIRNLNHKVFYYTNIIKDYVQQVDQNIFIYNRVSELSRTYKDDLIYPLIGNLQNMAGMRLTFGLSAACDDVKLKIISYLSDKDQEQLSVVSAEFKALIQYSTQNQICSKSPEKIEVTPPQNLLMPICYRRLFPAFSL